MEQTRDKSLRQVITAGIGCAAAFFVAGFLVASSIACSTVDQDKACDAAKRVYDSYQAVALVRDVSEDEKRIAAAAAAVLTLQCGWTATKGADANGVPVLVAPGK